MPIVSPSGCDMSVSIATWEGVQVGGGSGELVSWFLRFKIIALVEKRMEGVEWREGEGGGWGTVRVPAASPAETMRRASATCTNDFEKSTPAPPQAASARWGDAEGEERPPPSLVRRGMQRGSVWWEGCRGGMRVRFALGGGDMCVRFVLEGKG